MLSTQNKNHEDLIGFIKSNQDKFYRVAYSYSRLREDALDIVQDAIYKALKSSSQIKSNQYIKTWFYRILINTSITFLRKKKPSVNIDLISQSKLGVSEPKEYIDLYDALNQLDEADRMLIILRFFEGMKFKEIATVTNSNINTVKTRAYRILESMKFKLKEEVRCNE
jgi:RNA polymerase sigma-70 factor (ECF subfamily)